MKKNNSKEKEHLKSYAKYSSIAFQMLTIIFLGVFGGVKLDEVISSKFPVFTVILSIVSVILAIYFVTKDLIKNNKK